MRSFRKQIGVMMASAHQDAEGVSGKVVLDARSTSRIRKCWWCSWCKHPHTSTTPAREVYDKLGVPTGEIVPECTTTRDISYIVEVSLEEATKTGKGRVCPTCNRGNGSYVCDGFPTFQAASILPLDCENTGCEK